jgi:hypothetical protein
MPDAGDPRVRHSRISMLGTRMSDFAPNVFSNRIRRSRSSAGARGTRTRPRPVLLFVDLDKVTPPDHQFRSRTASICRTRLWVLYLGFRPN